MMLHRKELTGVEYQAVSFPGSVAELSGQGTSAQRPFSQPRLAREGQLTRFRSTRYRGAAMISSASAPLTGGSIGNLENSAGSPAMARSSSAV
jgi:hypothetical protein